MYYITYNGVSCEDIHVHVEERPALPAPVRTITSITIPGRDGELHEDNHAYQGNITIQIKMSYKCDKDQWHEVFRQVKKWLSTSGKLYLSDDPGFFFQCYYVVISDNARACMRTGQFTANFVCEPFIYSDEGQLETKNYYNDGYRAFPLYKIIGEGMCTLTVNGHEFGMNVGQNVTIDSDKKIAYRTDGTLVNTSVSGDYDNLALNEGENIITCTSGFTLSVIPRWRYL